MRPFISLCMIVKNEENVIGRCLASVVHLVDEVVIVDTGSTDKTKEIVATYTPLLFDFEWINDFSAARNFAASKASGEWILVLDADEYVDEENFITFLNELRNDNGKYDAYTAKILNFTGNYGENLVQNYHDRIYKNNGEISYYRKIHEQFKSNKNVTVNSSNSNLLIFHSGYLNQTVSEKSKNQRNKELLDKEFSHGGNQAFDYFNYGNEYCSIGEYEKALESYIEAYKLKKDFRLSWVSNTLIQIVLCLMNLKRYDEALGVIKDAEEIYINSPEFVFLRGEIFYLRGQLDDAKEMFQRIITNSDKYTHIIFRPDLKDQRPHLRLGEIYLSEEDYQNAIYHYTSVLNINKYNIDGVTKVISILDKFHSVEEIVDFLSAKQLVNSNNITVYVKVCFNIGNIKLAIGLLKDFDEDDNTLYKIALLKEICIKQDSNIHLLQDILEYTVLQEYIKTNFINIVDLFLLRNYRNENIKVAKLIELFEKEEGFKKLISFFDDSLVEEESVGELILITLQILLNYKEMNLSQLLLNKIGFLDKKYLPRVAALLYSKGYKVEAVQLYQDSDWSYFNDQDFINIINSLLLADDVINAVEVSNYAISIFNNDFRFYKLIIENTKDRERLSNTIHKARELFMESPYLDRIIF